MLRLQKQTTDRPLTALRGGIEDEDESDLEHRQAFRVAYSGAAASPRKEGSGSRRLGAQATEARQPDASEFVRSPSV